MDVRVEAAAMTAFAETGEALVVSILPVIRVTTKHRARAVASTRIPSMGRSSLSAIPNPVLFGGASLANAA